MCYWCHILKNDVAIIPDAFCGLPKEKYWGDFWGICLRKGKWKDCLISDFFLAKNIIFAGQIGVNYSDSNYNVKWNNQWSENKKRLKFSQPIGWRIVKSQIPCESYIDEIYM